MDLKWAPAPVLPGQPPSGTMVKELEPEDPEFQMVEDKMQSTIVEHRGNAGNGSRLSLLLLFL